MIYFLLCLLNLFICISLTLFWKGNMITTCVGPINLAERWQTKALTLPTCNICCFFDREFSLPKYLQKVAIYLASLLLFTFSKSFVCEKCGQFVLLSSSFLFLLTIMTARKGSWSKQRRERFIWWKKENTVTTTRQILGPTTKWGEYLRENIRVIALGEWMDAHFGP